ncbi:hypothetical protein EDEG_00522 [Edhazardia aedis USNM 41457]|uniref:Uncharacterized protein n=1 Tax=Edhazardia aedis (strain USNM 41457) TaxID=1003232 RepID=J9DIS9_EDHAE|nr:hypothetical protein EDEG_00522 [Edhazardia aedis USNM 41457]|eukprot:EJW01277.1 hypothetical protein EDEG_00522 [Edhazardia aedis USNM 41457]
MNYIYLIKKLTKNLNINIGKIKEYVKEYYPKYLYERLENVNSWKELILITEENLQYINRNFDRKRYNNEIVRNDKHYNKKYINRHEILSNGKINDKFYSKEKKTTL